MEDSEGRSGQSRGLRMVVFDVEGVILPKQRYLLEEMALLSRRDQLSVLFDGLLYEVGVRSLKTTLEQIYRHFRGVTFKDLAESFDRIPLVPGASEVIGRLRKEGLSIALISSGIPEPFVQRLAEKLDADYAFGPIFEVEEGRLTGRVSGEIIETDGKKAALARILEETSIPPSACAVVADDRNNLSMFRLGVLRVGFNPDSALTTQSDYVIRGELAEILPILSKNPETLTLDPGRNSQRIRETIHIGSFTVPLICQFLGFNRLLLSILILLVALGYVLGEAARLRGGSLPPFTTLTKLAATGPERWEYATAPLFLAAGVTLSLVVFPPPSGYVGITVVTLGDGVAKIVGRQWGRTVIPFNKPKKAEGTLAGLAASALVASLYVSPARALLAAGAGMLVEALPTPVNDNLLISIVASLAALTPL